MATDPQKPPARVLKAGPDYRVDDVVRLAATLFAQSYPLNKGVKTAEHLAQEAVGAARAFYAAIDKPSEPDRTPPG